MNCTVCELSLNKAVIKQQTKGVQVARLKLGKQILSQQKKKKNLGETILILMQFLNT